MLFHYPIGAGPIASGSAGAGAVVSAGSATTFAAVDMSLVPFPDAIEAPDFATIRDDMLAELAALDPVYADLTEADPAYHVIAVCASREVGLRLRTNEAVKAVALAYAEKTTLDNLAANYNVVRMLLDPGNPDALPPVAPTYEDDISLRRRAQLAYEGLSSAGADGFYIFHALGADPDVLDASVGSPEPGAVMVAVLSRTGDGTSSLDLCNSVLTTLSGLTTRPMTDNLATTSATILPYVVQAEITMLENVNPAAVLETAQAAMQAYADRSHRLGRAIAKSGIYAALHREGVLSVRLIQPSADIAAGWNQATYCTGITLTAK